jgi:hypothetical protein
MEEIGMKAYRFITGLGVVFGLSTGLAFSGPFTKSDIDIHGKGTLVGTIARSRYTTGDCWNRPYGFHCSMHINQEAVLVFKDSRFPNKVDPHEKTCEIHVKRVDNERFDVRLWGGIQCTIRKINDHDFTVE